MRESQLQTKVIRYLKSKGIYARKIHDLFTAGIPDIMCVIKSKAVFIELKSEKGKLSKIQELEIKKIREAFGLVIVARDLKEVKNFVEGLL